MGTYAEDLVMYSFGRREASYLLTLGCWVDSVPVR
jgi:hypothetical protein